MRKAEVAFLFVAVILLGASAAGWIGRLGVEYDEAHFLPPAVKAARGSPEYLKPPAGLYLGHRPFPFMTMAYVGGIDVPIYALPYAIFGTNPIVHRLVNLLMGAVILVLAYLLARRLHSPVAGVFAILLLLIDLEFLLHVPTNFGPFLAQMICSTAAMCLLARWWDGGRSWQFLLAAFLLGIGVQEKLTFVWVILGLFAGCVVYWRPIWRACGWRSLAGGGLLGLLGMLPVIWYAWGYPQFVFGYAKASSGVADWGVVFSQRVQQLRLLLDGQFTMTFLLGSVAPGVDRYSSMFWLIMAAIGSLAIGVILRHNPPKAAWFGLLYGTVFFACNMAFPEAGRLHHFLLLAPILQVSLGATLAWWWRVTWARLPLVALLALMSWSTTKNLLWFNGEVARTGGGIHWSAQINDLVAWASAHPELHYYTGSWGLARQLMTFPPQTLSINERFYPLLGDREGELRASLPRRDVIWLFSLALPTYVELREQVFTSARKLGYEPRPVATIGTLYQAYSFLPAESATPWQPATVREGVVGGEAASRFRATVGGDWNKVKTIQVELLDADHQVVESYFRPFEYYPMLEKSLTVEFGHLLYPDYFLQKTQSTKPIHAMRIFGEGGPVTVRDGSIRK